jgi:hypothetical protein
MISAQVSSGAACFVAVGAAHLDAEGLCGRNVDGEIAHAAGDQQLELG